MTGRMTQAHETCVQAQAIAQLRIRETRAGQSLKAAPSRAGRIRRMTNKCLRLPGLQAGRAIAAQPSIHPTHHLWPARRLPTAATGAKSPSLGCRDQDTVVQVSTWATALRCRHGLGQTGRATRTRESGARKKTNKEKKERNVDRNSCFVSWSGGSQDEHRDGSRAFSAPSSFWSVLRSQKSEAADGWGHFPPEQGLDSALTGLDCPGP